MIALTGTETKLSVYLVLKQTEQALEVLLVLIGCVMLWRTIFPAEQPVCSVLSFFCHCPSGSRGLPCLVQKKRKEQKERTLLSAKLASSSTKSDLEKRVEALENALKRSTSINCCQPLSSEEKGNAAVQS